MTPEAVVQNQLDAYNNRNIEDFIACHAKNVELFSFTESIPYLKGREHLKKTYNEIFESSPNLYSKLLKRIVFGNKVIDYEEITGRKGVELLELVAIYEIENEVIARAHFIRK
ncbi:hypothetical protein D7030_04240 [Flavobacteriaceae bacterium AU392]|nr:hypothetical protein D1817_10715 [Flavobacteriaceae bacterium]RKM85887.1 hypothetical protein D7030_04240 [Flavobacteriaceae bacterium AU392]